MNDDNAYLPPGEWHTVPLLHGMPPVVETLEQRFWRELGEIQHQATKATHVTRLGASLTVLLSQQDRHHIAAFRLAFGEHDILVVRTERGWRVRGPMAHGGATHDIGEVINWVVRTGDALDQPKLSGM